MFDCSAGYSAQHYPSHPRISVYLLGFDMEILSDVETVDLQITDANDQSFIR